MLEDTVLLPVRPTNQTRVTSATLVEGTVLLPVRPTERLRKQAGRAGGGNRSFAGASNVVRVAGDSLTGGGHRRFAGASNVHRPASNKGVPS